jgi:heat shock protein HslJ
LSKKEILYILLVLGLVLILAVPALMGCGRQPDADKTNDELDGSQWKLITLDGNQLVPGSYISLYFRENGTIWGFSGCNYLGGNYTASYDGTLSFSELSVTLIGCVEEGINEQEKAYLDTITAVASYSLEGNYLEMYDDTGRKFLVFDQLPEYAMDPADLVSTKWTLTLVNGEPVTTEEPVNIYFESSSSVTGEAGAFKEVFSYRASGDNIEWYGSRAIWSREEPSEEEMELARYTGMIAQGASYILSPNRLEIFTFKGDTLVYEPLIDTVPPSTVTCSALAVYLDHPYPGEPSMDYTREPVTITGYVNFPQASVMVNEVEAIIAGGGTFATTIRLKEGSNAIQAVATLGEQFDEITYLVGVNADGKMYAVPGLGSGGPRYQWQVMRADSLELEVGQVMSTILTLEIRKSIREPETFTYIIQRVKGEYSENEIPVPEGMDVEISPSQFTVCPNTNYHSLLTVSTVPGVTPGEYWFSFKFAFNDRGGGGGWIKISVTS